MLTLPLAVLLGAESAVALLCVLPALLGRLGHRVCALFAAPALRVVLRTVFGALVVVAADSLRTGLLRPAAAGGEGERGLLQDRLEQQESWTHLTCAAGCMVVLLLLADLHKWRREAERLERSLAVLKKQAQGAQAFLEQQQNEEERRKRAQKQKKSGGSSGGAGGAEEPPDADDEAQIKALRVARASAEAERDHATAERKAAQLESAALQKQAARQGEEYARLLEENSRLRDLFRGERAPELAELDRATARGMRAEKKAQ